MGVSHRYREPRVGGRVVAQRHTGDIVNRHRGHGAERDKNRATGGCAAFGPLLEAYYHHALNPQQAQSVAEHAAGCAACGAALERFAATDQLIAAAPTPRQGQSYGSGSRYESRRSALLVQLEPLPLCPSRGQPL